MIQITLSIIIIIFMSCSSIKTNGENTIPITIKKIECWLNLMPGGKPTFHYTGELEIKNVSKLNFQFDRIEFYADNILLNKSIPIVKSAKDHFTDSIETDKIIFFSKPNIGVTEQMLNADVVEVKFIFNINNKTIELTEKNIELLKTY